MAIEIKSRFDGRVLYTAENAQDVRAALEEAVAKRADLRSADLRYADLRYADLRYADLRYADLRSANLGYANLGSANLRYANLGSANLGSANLGSADLRSADDPAHPFYSIRVDFWAVLDQTPAEVAGLHAALREGRVDGTVYEGDCACLVGTLANVRGCAYDEMEVKPQADRPAEQWVYAIRKGDVPTDEPAKDESEGVFRVRVALRWIDEWFESRRRVAAALSVGEAA